MSTADRTDYWLQRIEKDKLGVVARLIEYEAELDRHQALPDGKQRREVVEAILENAEQTAVVLDGFDACIVGLNEDNLAVVYSKQRIFQALRTFCKTHLEALDYYEFNILPVAGCLDAVIVDDTIF
jgi:hypothetical protein